MKHACLGMLLALTGCQLDACAAIASRAAGMPDLYWRASPHAFDAADVDGDGSEEIVGLCHHALDEALKFCAYDVAKGEVLWETGSLPADDAQQSQVVIRGDRVLLTDQAATARVVSLADGKELSSRQLTERASESCKPAEHPDAVWLRLADDTAFLYTPSSDTLAAAPRPASCPVTGSRAFAGCMVLGGSGCGRFPPPERDAMLMPTAVAYDGQIGALLAANAKGTTYTVIIGFQVGQTDLLFSRPVAEGSPIAAGSSDYLAPITVSGGRVFTRDDEEVVALDAYGGKTLWRTRAGAFNTLHASATRLYVGRWTAIQVYDVDSGELLATIGHR